MSTIKSLLKNKGVALFLFLFLISSVSFAMGYLYAKEQNPAPIIIQKSG